MRRLLSAIDKLFRFLRNKLLSSCYKLWYWLFLLILGLSAYAIGEYFSSLINRNQQNRENLPFDAISNPEAAIQISSERNGIFIDPHQLEIGELWEDRDYVANISLHNQTDKEIEIGAFAPSCTCTKIEPSELTIPPRGMKKIAVHIDLTERQPNKVFQEKHPFEVQFTPLLGLKQKYPGSGWEISGTVRHRIGLEFARLSFEEDCYQGVNSTRKVRVKINQPIKEIKAITVPESLATVRVEKIPESNDQNIYITPNPVLPIGSWKGKIQFQVIDKQDREFSAATLYIHGETRIPILTVPHEGVLGAQKLNSKVKEILLLKSFNKSWKIVSLELGQNKGSIREFVDKPEESHPSDQSVQETALARRFEIDLPILFPGYQTIPVKIMVENPKGEKQVLEWKLSYIGVSNNEIAKSIPKSIAKP